MSPPVGQPVLVRATHEVADVLVFVTDRQQM
jgi:hypothetical protein